jgi:ClpP class serine protease
MRAKGKFLGKSPAEKIESKPIVGEYLKEKDKKRLDLIRDIEHITGRTLITYIANFNHPLGGIHYNDIIAFEDLLRSAKKPNRIDLLINSPGGELNTTEKILYMCRQRTKKFRTIIPNAAKSGATMIALGSDEILMGHLSELGPIDPQIPRALPNGKMTLVPARSLLDSLEKIKECIKNNEPPAVYMPLLAGFNIELIDICEKAIGESKEVAETWLKKYMLEKNKKRAEKIAETLGDTKKFKSHGKLISAKEAKDMGLNIKILDKNGQLWNKIWEYYCRAELSLNESGAAKMVENSQMTLSQGVSVRNG